MVGYPANKTRYVAGYKKGRIYCATLEDSRLTGRVCSSVVRSDDVRSALVGLPQPQPLLPTHFLNKLIFMDTELCCGFGFQIRILIWGLGPDPDSDLVSRS